MTLATGILIAGKISGGMVAIEPKSKESNQERYDRKSVWAL
jgi:hypothetical protein